ncbi:GIY-YIG nuclease family protein [Chelatococcus asaccharovorans]|uniref:Putative endonuclease n=1 Tax=Chelatococcus asaccharovorans TaxID=28210 RepID=A0A2V3TRT1_9HYPH|nr:GIY-YIG nuclease family protein [Chelatococcus asaccharovorans]MBS7704856.1 GIY-YIG nuclease family protein [Chelatococcus asaccharovorans]PXW51319.1 putative endonuclease [Chelatococcus asaccharovorans]
MKQPCVYILASRPGGAIYVGVTSHLARRIWEHRQGLADSHTKRYGITRLIYYEQYDRMMDAIQRERTMKHWPRVWKTRLIASMNPEWRDLYDDLA